MKKTRRSLMALGVGSIFFIGNTDWENEGKACAGAVKLPESCTNHKQVGG